MDGVWQLSRCPFQLAKMVKRWNRKGHCAHLGDRVQDLGVHGRGRNSSPFHCMHHPFLAQ